MFSLDKTQLPVVIDPVKDMFSKAKDVRVPDSWFFVINLTTKEGKAFDALVHYMVMDPQIEGKPSIYMTLHCILDRLNKKYVSKEFVYDKTKVKISDCSMDVNMPDLVITGGLDNFNLKANMPNGNILDVAIQPTGNVLYNCSTGKFKASIGITGHYALPNMKTSGKLSYEGEMFEVTGTSWLDRQWGEMTKEEEAGMMSAEKGYGWIWFSLQMDNGDYISIWDFMNTKKESSMAWATILQPDGTHLVAPITPLMKNASHYWKSEATGQNYPTAFKILIPSLDIDLQVQPVVTEQEVVSVWDTKYEGAGDVTGTYKGKATQSTSFYELVGNWKD